MAGEEYESPVTGLKYTVPIYEEPADAPLAFKEFADSITVGGPASREYAVLQALEGDSGLAWAEGMALQVVDAVPADTDGEIGDVVFIPGGPGGSTPAVGGGKVLQIVRATDITQRTTVKTTSLEDANISVTISPQKADSALILIWSVSATLLNGPGYGKMSITDNSDNEISATQCTFGSNDTTEVTANQTIIGYDTPATTSATTYKGMFGVNSGGTLRLRNSSGVGQLYAIELEDVVVSP